MSVLVDDGGLRPRSAEDLAAEAEAVPFDERDTHRGIVVLQSRDDPAALAPYLPALRLVRIDFPAFQDGRGFSQARQLRRLGFTGHLRAQGHLLPDQYAMLRRVGFDDVEISDEEAARQGAAAWAARRDWQALDYQARLRAPAPPR